MIDRPQAARLDARRACVAKARRALPQGRGKIKKREMDAFKQFNVYQEMEDQA